MIKMWIVYNKYKKIYMVNVREKSNTKDSDFQLTICQRSNRRLSKNNGRKRIRTTRIAVKANIVTNGC